MCPGPASTRPAARHAPPAVRLVETGSGRPGGVCISGRDLRQPRAQTPLERQCCRYQYPIDGGDAGSKSLWKHLREGTFGTERHRDLLLTEEVPKEFEPLAARAAGTKRQLRSLGFPTSAGSI
jgi:hypothetical protein